MDNRSPDPLPDVLVIGRPDTGEPALSRRAAVLRRAALPVAVAALLVAAVAGTGRSGTPSVPVPAAAPSPPVTEHTAPVFPPRLVIPREAGRGRPLTVLAYRNGRLCGPAELRFDGVAVPQRVVLDLGPVDGEWTALILTMDIPRTAVPGRHLVQLHGPRPGGRGPVCSDVPEYQGRISELPIVVR